MAVMETVVEVTFFCFLVDEVASSGGVKIKPALQRLQVYNAVLRNEYVEMATGFARRIQVESVHADH